MVSARDYHDFIICGAIDKAVCIIYAPTPIARQIAHQRLRFAHALERVATYRFYQLVDAF